MKIQIKHTAIIFTGQLAGLIAAWYSALDGMNLQKFKSLVLSFIIALLAVPLALVLPAYAVTPPSISPGTGTFLTAQTVTMTAAAGTIYYTENGGIPDNTSTAYSAPITVSGPTQINAVAFSSGVYSTVTTVYLDVNENLMAVLQPAGLILRLQSGLGVSTDLGNPGPVKKWADLSGLGNDATGLYSTEPLLLASAASSMPAVSFDGSSEYLVLPSGFANFTTANLITIGNTPPTGSSNVKIVVNGTNATYSFTTADTSATIASGLSSAINALAISGVSATSSGGVIKVLAPITTTLSYITNLSITVAIQPAGFTAIVVTAPTGLTANARIFDLGNAGSGNNVLNQISSSGSLAQFSAFNGGSGTNAQSASALTQNQFQVVATVQSPGATHGSATVYVNGLPGTTNTSMNNIPNVTRTSNFIGQGSSTGNFYAGKISDVLIYSTTLSIQQIEAIVAFFAQEYQIPGQTPAAPIISVPTGTLNGPTQVTIASEAGVITRYTTDGTTPLITSAAFSGSPLLINYSQTLNAIAFKDGVQSSMTSATYTLDTTQWPAPGSSVTAPSITLQLPRPSL